MRGDATARMPPLERDVPSTRRGALAAFGAAVALLLLSRLPFLLAQPDWGVFFTEHMWLITDWAAVSRWEEVTGQTASLATLDPGLYRLHYHGGAAAIAEAVGWMGALTGDVGLLQLQLVGLLLSVVAVTAYLAGLRRIWPDDHVRHALSLFIVWLAPPTLLLWLTLMPMGHYMESWLFHALALPALAHTCSGRGGARFLAAVGVAAGLATVYVVSNVVFLGLIGGAFLLWAERPLRARLLPLVGMVITWAVTWAVAGGPRGAEAYARLTAPVGPAEEGPSLLARMAQNGQEFLSWTALVDGVAWCQRGVFAVFEPASDPTGRSAALLLAAAVGAGALYLLWHTVQLVVPARRAGMGLPERILAVHGVLLVLTASAFLAVREPTAGMELVSYTTLSYCGLMFGLAQGAAALVSRPKGPGRLVSAGIVGGLVLLLAAGWFQSSRWTLRPVDRPNIQSVEFRRVAEVARMKAERPEGADGAARVTAYCNAAYPDNAAFCNEIGWLTAFPEPARGRSIRSVVTELAAVCATAPPDQRVACAIAAGARAPQSPICDVGMPSDSVAERCDPFPEGLRQACLTGLHRGPLPRVHHYNPCAVQALQGICGFGDPDVVPDWRYRACLEASSSMLTGMPPMPPAPTLEPTHPCAGWPADWQGICVSVAAATRAEAGTPSCEDIYFERFATGLPAENRLIYGQCAYAGALPTGWDAYPSCVIGIARALEGVSCSWAGDALHL